MSKNYFSDIIKQFVRHRYPEETEEKIQGWLINSEHQSEKEKEIRDFWQSLDMDADKPVYESLNAVNKRLGIKPKAQKKSLRPQLTRVAAALIPFILIAGAIFYMIKPHDKMLTINVPYGEQKQLTLPDESTVWLNSGTTIKYPEKFSNGSRIVQLSGEAYFSVTRNTESAFLVETEKLKVKVLGTEFNVQSYAEDSVVTVSVTKGKVQITAGNKVDHILTTSQKITYNKFSDDYRIDSLNTENTQNWKNRELVFEKRTLEEILKVLERAYNIHFESDKTLSADKNLYTIKFINQESIEQIMDILGEMAGFSYSIDNNNIKLSKTE